MNLTFLNDINEMISEEMAIASGNYCKLLKVDGRIKEAQYFVDRDLQSVECYLEKSKSDKSAKDKYKGKFITIYKLIEAFGSYRYYEVESLDPAGQLAGKRIEVHGKEDRLIYDKAFDIASNKVYLVTKYLYEKEQNVRYEFLYDNETGNFIHAEAIDPSRFYDTKEARISRDALRTGFNPFRLSWDGLDYYKHADPILPVREEEEYR